MHLAPTTNPAIIITPVYYRAITKKEIIKHTTITITGKFSGDEIACTEEVVIRTKFVDRIS